MRGMTLILYVVSTEVLEKLPSHSESSNIIGSVELSNYLCYQRET